MLLPLMQRRVIGEKDVLFKADDPAHALFYLLEGTLHRPEIDKELGPGSIIGEFALFSDTGRRTATAVAKTDCIVMALTKSAVCSALVQHPQLGIHLLRMCACSRMRTGRARPGRRQRPMIWGRRWLGQSSAEWVRDFFVIMFAMVEVRRS